MESTVFYQGSGKQMLPRFLNFLLFIDKSANYP
jgi:hypothetical protein